VEWLKDRLRPYSQTLDFAKKACFGLFGPFVSFEEKKSVADTASVLELHSVERKSRCQWILKNVRMFKELFSTKSFRQQHFPGVEQTIKLFDTIEVGLNEGYQFWRWNIQLFTVAHISILYYAYDRHLLPSSSNICKTYYMSSL